MANGEMSRTTSRRRFLREALVTLGAGLGVVLIPVTAHAAGTTCCKDTTCPHCDNGLTKYRCSSTCPGGPNGCRCYTAHTGSCFSTGC
jgi:hypothetical protein